MKNRSCQLWLAIVSAGGTVKRYSLKPLAAAELGAAFVAGYRLLNRSESPSPVYHVRLSPSAVLSCTCPAFVWDRQRGQAKGALPDQPAPTCKHCDALRAAGLLPLGLVQLLAARNRLLDQAEQTIKNRDLEREAAIRNADSLRASIASLESQLRAVTDRALRLQAEVEAYHAGPPVIRRPARKRRAA